MGSRLTFAVADGSRGPDYSRSGRASRLSRALKNRWMYLMVVPGVLYFAVFKYLPMWGC